MGGRTCSFKDGGLSTLAARARPGRCGRGPVHGLLSSADRGSSPGQAEQLRAALGWGWTPDCILSPQRANKGSKAIERLRKKLSEQESLLLLMSPNMAFRVHSRHGKVRDRRPRQRRPRPRLRAGPASTGHAHRPSPHPPVTACWPRPRRPPPITPHLQATPTVVPFRPQRLVQHGTPARGRPSLGLWPGTPQLGGRGVSVGLGAHRLSVQGCSLGAFYPEGLSLWASHACREPCGGPCFRPRARAGGHQPSARHIRPGNPVALRCDVSP